MERVSETVKIKVSGRERENRNEVNGIGEGTEEGAD